MKIWRGLSKRILLASVLSALVGCGSWYAVTRIFFSDILLRTVAPLILYVYRNHDHAQCEASPSTWSGDMTIGATTFAYDAVSLTSQNPRAPAMSRALYEGFTPGLSPPIVIDPGSAFRGGGLLFRGAESGPCAWLMATWGPKPQQKQLMGLLFACGLVVTATAAALALVAAVRPITVRIDALRRAAVHVGDAELFTNVASDDDDDELASVASSLGRAHERIRADAEKLVRRQRDLQRYLADVAHDLRTPIASLQLALEQAEAAAAGDAAQAELIAGAINDAVYLAALTNNLRLASELREGWDPMSDDARVDLGETVERVVARGRFLARRRGISLEMSVPDDPVVVRCNPIAAEQAVSNVVDNALAHGARGGHVAVVLETKGAQFTLRISDDGPGVPPAELPRLGERTFRSDEARQRDPRGTGLGLAITSEVCTRCAFALTFGAETPRGLRVEIGGKVA